MRCKTRTKSNLIVKGLPRFRLFTGSHLLPCDIFFSSDWPVVLVYAGQLKCDLCEFEYGCLSQFLAALKSRSSYSFLLKLGIISSSRCK